jgi:hypothetical protein
MPGGIEMEFIAIDKDKFEVDIVQETDDEYFNIQLKREPIFNTLSPIEQIVYYEILYRAVYAEDKKIGREVAYSLIQPDPWLCALAVIMWQGIIQGLSWDAIKVIVHRALNKMRDAGVAPKKKNETINKKLEIGFHWTKYSDDGKKLYDMFLGIRRVYNRMAKEQREIVSEIDSKKVKQMSKKEFPIHIEK